jgi:stage II sporulation protein D
MDRGRSPRRWSGLTLPWRPLSLVAAALACGSASAPSPVLRPTVIPIGVRTVRVGLADGATSGDLSATGAWLLLRSAGTKTLVRGTGRGTWTVARSAGGRLRITNETGETATKDGPFTARVVDKSAFLTWNGKRYRGELEIRVASHGIVVINRLPVEDYIRGVVSLELGEVSESELAALEAQAVAARSYTYTRMGDPDGLRRAYDLVPTVSDQVYGGVGGETRLGDLAVAQTNNEVLAYAGRVVNAPYFAACGGSTAEPSEVWRQSNVPYLQRVSDQVPGTNDRYYCDGSSKFRWSRTFSGTELITVLERYLPHYAADGWRGVGRVRAVAAESLTPSGRVGNLLITTDRTTYRLRGNDIRFVFRDPNGEILNSTYFVVEQTVGSDGRVSMLTLRGQGNGHGVGMCQAGAIGRARAGQDYHTILQTYYPGTTIATVG